ncbi:hypothetical protein [Pseudanabaena sp. FACHB-2040]|uniref:hypothetical protein n=1 Tax=Pseudanabaena sp. FACHB-2040 TaxID=2692859 RepID=UPI0016826DC9|nr:hypothetical protein [Pseudanabaena sp. FACHB-2040]MBD2256307.1 hypothetical protein [Pseudanabaena sp. FACHB-2040]
MGISLIGAGATHQRMKTKAPYDAKMLELLLTYRQTPSTKIWDQLVRLNSGLVRKVVCRLCQDYSNAWQALEEAGFQGLTTALEAFDPKQKTEFSVFAIPYIQAAVVAGLSQHSLDPKRCASLGKWGIQRSASLT